MLEESGDVEEETPRAPLDRWSAGMELERVAGVAAARAALADGDGSDDEGARPFASILNPRARAFLAAFVIVGTLSGAARASGVSRYMHDRWRGAATIYGAPVAGLPGYVEAFAVAEVMAADLAEESARERAIYGQVEPVYWRGKIVGYVRKPSDRLMELILTGLRPEKYRRRIDQTISGPGGGPVRVAAAVALRTLSDEDLLAIAGGGGPVALPALPGGLPGVLPGGSAGLPTDREELGGGADPRGDEGGGSGGA